MTGRVIFAGAVLISILLFYPPQLETRAASLVPTAVPVVFTHTINASKSRVGDIVAARTIQDVQFPDGVDLPKGSMVLGHVTAARAFSFDPAPYAVQQPSFLSVRLDKLVTKTTTVPVKVSVRAMADTLESEDASTPHYLDETDAVGTRVQIGGDTFNPFQAPVTNSQGDIVAYNRRKGVFARLLPGDYVSRYSHLTCDGIATEQSVAIFSAGACGLYGFVDMYMTENGIGKNSDTFRLESRRHTVTLYGQSTALLQITVVSRTTP